MKLNFTKAFSLIEISIVLIVISLIIGCIVGGKSLLIRAKINIIISELDSFKIAIRDYVITNKITNIGLIDNGNIDYIPCFSTLIDNGYLYESNNFIKNIDSCNKEYYNSKLSSTGWFIDYGDNFILLSLANIDSYKDNANNLIATIDDKVCKQFKDKYDKLNIDDVCTKNDFSKCENYAIFCENDINNTKNKKILSIYIKNIEE